MKRHIQLPGVRKWSGDDLIELQSQSLEILDKFFKQYGNMVVAGCEVVDTAIAPGLVALMGKDENNVDTYKVVPFKGASNIDVFPVYLVLTHTTIERDYETTQVLPIAYDYEATLQRIRPDNVPYLELKRTGNNYFVEAIQDATHRFFTDDEREKLETVALNANNYIHPKSHPASMIDEDATHRFFTDDEREKLETVALNANNYIHPKSHPASMIDEDATHRFFTDDEREKLETVALNANNYIHPKSHPASAIVFDDGTTFQEKLAQGLLRGLKGDKGDTGAQGIQGPQGVQGERGYTGAQGAQGPRGETGSVGPKGDTGAQGIQGPQGVQGERGYTGAQGVQGPRGETGSVGPKGDAGAQGIQGPQGVQGPIGTNNGKLLYCSDPQSADDERPLSVSSKNEYLINAMDYDYLEFIVTKDVDNDHVRCCSEKFTVPCFLFSNNGVPFVRNFSREEYEGICLSFSYNNNGTLNITTQFQNCYLTHIIGYNW